jgi:hypothetical protein
MENSTLEVWSVPLRHRVPTAGFHFREKQPGLNIEKFKIENGLLCIKATKPGSGRINVRAIVGGNAVGGTNIGGSYVDREIEVVVRGRVAENGAWL